MRRLDDSPGPRQNTLPEPLRIAMTQKPTRSCRIQPKCAQNAAQVAKPEVPCRELVYLRLPRCLGVKLLRLLSYEPARTHNACTRKFSAPKTSAGEVPRPRSREMRVPFPLSHTSPRNARFLPRGFLLYECAVIESYSINETCLCR